MTQHSLFIVVCWEQTHLTQHHATVILHCKPHSCSHHTPRTHSWPSYSHSWGALERLSKQMRAVSSGESIIPASCKPLCGCLGVSSRNRGGPSLHWYVVDYSAETLLTILKTRILPSTTIISNCWGSTFISVMKNHVKVHVSPYNWKTYYIFCLTKYLALCAMHTIWIPSPCLSTSSEMLIGDCAPCTKLLADLPHSAPL